LYISGEYSHASTYSFRFTFGHRNQFSQFITLLIPLIFAGIFYEEKRWKKIFLSIVVIFIYIIAILLKSRAVIIVLIFIYPAISSFFFLFRSKNKANKYVKYSISVLLSLGIIVLLSFPIKDLPYVNKLVEISYGSGNERIRLWANSLELFKENPFLGKGSGDWKIEILRTPLEHTQAENSIIFYNRAHNDFIQILVENGIIGLLLYLMFFIVGIIYLFRSVLNPMVKAILFSGVLSFLIFSNFSFPLEKIEHLFLLFLFLSPGMKANKKNTKLVKSLFIIFSSLVLFFSILWIVEEKKYTNAIDNNKLEIIQKMSKSFYTIDPTTLPLEWYIANDYFINDDYENAISSYKKSLKHNPYHVHAINNLGSSYYKRNNLALAEVEYKKALELNPKFTETIMNYSSLCFNNGRIDEALLLILTVKKELEPETYKSYISAIGNSKISLVISKENDETFIQYLNKNKSNNSYLYQIAIACRKSGLSYENQIRKNYGENIFVH
jgi:tetratricopeptide (TPR) repeat protein